MTNILSKQTEQDQTRKPLLIDGARHTGKTFLLQELFGHTFANTLRIDFLENPLYKEAFDGALSPDELIINIELIAEQRFNPETDLLILDEIGECERAVTSLKYFAEKAPSYFVTASGSNIGLLNTFPVGKVEHYYLTPLTFQEFLYASEESALIKAFDTQANAATVHNKLLGKFNAALIESIFNNIPTQLSLVIDESVKRFKFKNIYERKSRYTDFETAIHWLLRSYVEKCAPSKTFKLTGTQGSPASEKTHIVMPLYYIQYLLNKW